MTSTTKSIILVMVILLSSGVSHGDRIILKNKRTITGRLTEKGNGRITIQSHSEALTFHEGDILEIVEETPAENFLLDAQSKTVTGNLAGAFDSYAESLSAGLPYNRLEEHILLHGQKILGVFQTLDGVRKEKMGAPMAKILPQRGQSYLSDSATSQSLNFGYFMAQLLSETGEPAKAREILSSLPRRMFDNDPVKRYFALKVLKSETLRLAESGDFNSALAILENIQGLDANLGRSSRILIYMKWAAHLRDQSQWREAADIYAGQLKSLSIEIAANRFSFLIDKLQGSAKNVGNYAKGIEILEKYGALLSPAEARRHLVEFSTAAGKLALDDNDTTTARAFFNRVFLTTGQKDPELLNLCTYKERALALRNDDFLGHYRLGMFCRKSGLMKEAERHFRHAANAPELRASALSEIRMMRAHERIEKINEAMKLYDRSEYIASLDTLQPLLNDTSTTEGLTEANRLAELCRRRLRAESEQRPMKALVYYQQAERHYLLEEHDAAILKLEIILENYPDTPIAEKARELMLAAIKKRNLAQLEKTTRGADFSSPSTTKSASSNTNDLNSQIKELMKILGKE